MNSRLKHVAANVIPDAVVVVLLRRPRPCTILDGRRTTGGRPTVSPDFYSRSLSLSLSLFLFLSSHLSAFTKGNLRRQIFFICRIFEYFLVNICLNRMVGSENVE